MKISFMLESSAWMQALALKLRSELILLRAM